MADPYSLLGVNRSASEQEIKSAYRKLAKELHPDRNKDNPKAAERFNLVTRAYDLLSDKDKRAQFDRGDIDADGNPTHYGGGYGGGPFRGGARSGPGAGQGGAGQGGAAGGGFAGAEDIDLGDLFEGLFGRGTGGRAGSGSAGGFARRPQAQRGADMQYRLQVPFVDAASRTDQRITLADGSTIDLKLPAGLADGTQMRLKGKGQPGPAGAGDALVTIEIIAHPFFTRTGDDVRLELPVTLDEAVKGAKVKVPTVDGPVMLTIAPGTSSGKILRLKGKGFSRKDGARGDQLVEVQIQLPHDITALAEKLAGWHDETSVRANLGL